ncbi:MAG: hypothetical protein HZA80_01305 [Candidatus Taylorbacteria bacterium]|nr:hypothetical protein [Candidatus Taylorbacteria bacterium]
MDRRSIRIILKASLILITLFIIVGYALYSSKEFVSGPQLTIVSPIDGEVLSTSTIIVQGVAKNIKNIYFNDRPILIDEQGNFREISLLHEGYNVFTLKADDRFNRHIDKTLHLVYTRQ